MDSEKIKKIEKSIENLKNKTAKIYFLVQDTNIIYVFHALIYNGYTYPFFILINCYL